MKQTNNAIKFLMAQYRAIFKNANLKMFLAAATAAAAVAAGSAQAATPIDVWTGLNTSTSTVDGTTNNLAIKGGKVENQTGFTVSITGGEDNTIQGDGTTAGAFTVKAGQTSSISLDVASPDASKTNLKIGLNEANKNASVTIDTFTNNKGTLEIIGQGADAASSSLNATTVTIGDGVTADQAFVKIGANGTLKATGAAGEQGLFVKKGAKIDLAGGTLSATNLVITDGKIEASKASKITGKNISMTSGSITATEGLTITAQKGGSFQASGGTISIAKTKALTLAGESVINGTKITNDGGKLVINGTSTLADGSLDLSANKSGSVVLYGKEAANTSTLKVSSTELANAMKGGVETSGAGIGVIEIQGTDPVDLATTDGVAVLSDTGTLGAKLTISDTSTLKVKGTTGSFTKADKVDAGDKKFTLSFDTLTVGAGDAVTLESGAGLEVSKLLTVGKGATSTLTVNKGSLTLNGTTTGEVKAKAIELKAGSSDAATTSSLDANGGDWTVGALTLTKGTVKVTKGGITVGDALTLTADSDLIINSGYVSTLGSGSLVAKDAKANGIALTGGILKVDGSDILKNNALDTNLLKGEALKGDASSRLEITLGDDVKLTGDEFSALKTALGSFKGIYKVSVDTGMDPAADVTLDQIKKYPQLETDAFNKSTLTLKNTDVIDQNYSIGNVLMTEGGDLELADNGAFTLNTAKDNYFVAKKSGEGVVAADIKFNGTGTNSLTLVGDGKIGSIITKDATTKGTLTLGIADDKAPKSANVTIDKGSIGDAGKSLSQVDLTNGSTLTVKSGDVYALNLKLGDESKLSVSGKVAVDTAAIENATITVGSFIISDSQGANAFKFDEGKMNVTGTLSFGQGNTATIGTAGDVVPPAVTTAEGDAVPPVPAPNPGTSAQVFAGTVELKTGSTIFVDPSSSIPSSLLVGKVLSDGTTEGKLAGNLAIGNNSAIAFGYDEEGFVSAVSNYMVDGKFNADLGIKNALVLNTPITVADGAWINVDAGLTKAEQGNSADLNLADGATLIITKDALANGAAITFEKTGSGTVAATEKSSIRLEGGITLADNNKQLFGNAKTDTAKAKIYAAAGLINGELKADGTVTLTANDEKLKEVRAVASAPVADLLVDYRDGKFANNSGAGLDFIGSSLLKNDFVAIDAAAHAATYAGAQQAAVAAVGTMAEAVGGRVGSMGVEAATIAATGSQVTGGVWLSPMYKSVDADGFNAQGASYGADIDLAGVAFGADTVDGNTRYGVVFNIGSGEAEGKGNGNGLKDDFDYYGIGLYSVRASNNFAVVADASYNVISHDVEGLGAKGSAETVALTAGLTGQYTMSSPMVDVTPHLGARFIRLDTDSYDLVAGGDVVAETDFDVQNVFSVPLGVTLSKAFEMGGWSLAPSADLSITFNTGDTDVESNTYFTGTKNYGFTTEVLDEVTYGIAVGLGAQYGAFGTNIGLNYTGSENTDSFGVNAQARYMF